jgi:hypothetical protein
VARQGYQVIGEKLHCVRLEETRDRLSVLSRLTSLEIFFFIGKTFRPKKRGEGKESEVGKESEGCCIGDTP